jgi:hypothetical protein
MPLRAQVLLFDNGGEHAALQAAEVIAESGATLEIMTPDRTFAPEVMAMNLVPYLRSLQKVPTGDRGLSIFRRVHGRPGWSNRRCSEI